MEQTASPKENGKKMETRIEHGTAAVSSFVFSFFLLPTLSLFLPVSHIRSSHETFDVACANVLELFPPIHPPTHTFKRSENRPDVTYPSKKAEPDDSNGVLGSTSASK